MSRARRARSASRSEFLAPGEFRTLPLPSYPEIRLALTAAGRRSSGGSTARSPTPFTSRPKVRSATPCAASACGAGCRSPPASTPAFPIISPSGCRCRERWTCEVAWALAAALSQRRRGGAGGDADAGAPNLPARGFKNVKLWPRGVDAKLFRPRAGALLNLPRPIFLTVGRLAVEKNLEAFLKLDLPGSKLVVGDGPARDALAKAYPDAVFLGSRQGEALAEIYAAADVFVFPSRTDTFGLVLLEALASGVPVAGFPAAAPRDVIGEAPVGVLDEDLQLACLGALECSRDDCRDFALSMTWEASARMFLEHVTEAAKAGRKLAACRRESESASSA